MAQTILTIKCACGADLEYSMSGDAANLVINVEPCKFCKGLIRARLRKMAILRKKGGA